MKKSIQHIIFGLSVFTLVLVGCQKEDFSPNENTEEPTCGCGNPSNESSAPEISTLNSNSQDTGSGTSSNSKDNSSSSNDSNWNATKGSLKPTGDDNITDPNNDEDESKVKKSHKQ